MAKPSFPTAPSELFAKTRDAVIVLTDEQVRQEWAEYGCPVMANYGLDWGHGKDEDGQAWAAIFNTGQEWKESPFILFCEAEDMLSKDLPRFSKWARRACVLAARMQLLKWRPERL